MMLLTWSWLWRISVLFHVLTAAKTNFRHANFVKPIPALQVNYQKNHHSKKQAEIIKNSLIRNR